MLKGRDILCYANDWSADPTSKHHLMRRLAETNRVLWIEASGMRAPNLVGSAADRSRALRKVKRFFQPSRRVLPNLHVYSPPVLPFPESPVARSVNRVLYRATITRELRRLGFAPRPLTWVFGPNVMPLIREIPRGPLVYHCVDRWAEFSEYNGALLAEWEEELGRSADLVLASARDLAEHCRQFNDRVHYVPHGVDFAHFAAALAPGKLPPDLEGIPGPRVGFFGLIHEWVDVELIRELATRTPYSFVLIGDAKVPLDALAGLPNVHHLGRKPFQSLPAYCRGFDAAIVPFRTSALTRSVNPIKLREYAAAGLPVVSTDLPEIRSCADISAIATDAEGWVRELRAAVERGGRAAERQAQSERVRSQDWTEVCRRISDLVEGGDAGAERSAA